MVAALIAPERRAAAPDGWAGHHGRLIEAVDRLAPSTEDMIAYASGGEAMIHAVRDRLTGRGLDRKRYRWEKFW